MAGFNQPENTVSIIRGTSKTFELTVTDETGAVVNLTGAKVIFTIKASLTDPLPLVQKTSDQPSQVEITSPREGKARIYLTPMDTQSLDPYQYAFDVWVVLSSGKRYAVIPPSVFEVKPGVTLIPL